VRGAAPVFSRAGDQHDPQDSWFPAVCRRKMETSGFSNLYSRLGDATSESHGPISRRIFVSIPNLATLRSQIESGRKDTRDVNLVVAHS